MFIAVICSLALLVPTYATSPENESTTTKDVIHIVVSDCGAEVLDSHTIASYSHHNVSSTGDNTVIALPITVKETTEATTTIDLINTNRITDTAKRVSLANCILELCGYSYEDIEQMDNKTKVDLTTGLEIGVTRAAAKATDSVTNTYSNWASTLSYTRKNTDW